MIFAILDPYFGEVNGSQKVTLNLLKSLKENGENPLSLICDSDSTYSDEIKSLTQNYFFKAPLASWVKNNVCSGKFDSLHPILKVMKFLSGAAAVFLINLQSLYFCLKNNVQVAYLVDPRAIVLCGLFLRIFGVKVIWHLHGELHFDRRIKKSLLGLCHVVIVPSDAIRNSLPYTDKCHVVYNGFDFFPLRKQRSVGPLADGFDNNKVVRLVFVGSIVPHKGLHNLLDALCGISTLYIDLHVVGGFGNDDLYKVLIYDKVDSLPENICVKFHGRIENPYSIINDSDFLVFPSVIFQSLRLGNETINIRSSEALPTVIIEALAYGVPVVATSVPGVSEIMENKVQGVIIEDSSPELLKNAILAIVSESDKKILDVDSEHVRLRFSREKMCSRFLEILNEALRAS